MSYRYNKRPQRSSFRQGTEKTEELLQRKEVVTGDRETGDEGRSTETETETGRTERENSCEH